MNPSRQRRLMFVIFIVCILASATGLILFALRQNINLFYSPSDLLEGKNFSHRLIRVGGMVVEGSIIRKGLSVQFALTDFKQTITVHYKGILPDLFREGQGIVTLGHWSQPFFKATEVLAKHDANYMPREVKSMLAQSNKGAYER